jgi:hypothetical protein
MGHARYRELEVSFGRVQRVSLEADDTDSVISELTSNAIVLRTVDKAVCSEQRFLDELLALIPDGIAEFNKKLVDLV